MGILINRSKLYGRFRGLEKKSTSSRVLSSALVLYALTCLNLSAQISFSSSSSSWGGSSFYGTGVQGDPYRTSSAPGATSAYGGGQLDVDGTQFRFGFMSESLSSVSSYDLSSTDLSAGTPLILQFTNLTAAPRYVAYTGGDITSYSYGGGNLTIHTSVIAPAASGSNPDGTELQAAFGMLIETGGEFDYAGSIFQTDMYWGDMESMQSYTGNSPLAGINANGQDGREVTFKGYFSTEFLRTLAIDSPAECDAFLQKSDTTSNLSISRVLYTTDGTDPGLPGGSYSFGGASAFNFDGTGNADTVVAIYSNDSWSQGNIGIVPEPCTSALFLVGLGGLLLAKRKRYV